MLEQEENKRDVKRVCIFRIVYILNVMNVWVEMVSAIYYIIMNYPYKQPNIHR